MKRYLLDTSLAAAFLHGRPYILTLIEPCSQADHPYPLTYPILERYADIRRTLWPLHKDIGDIDALIAATALEEGLIFLTIDHDYECVPGLKYELVNLKKAA